MFLAGIYLNGGNNTNFDEFNSSVNNFISKEKYYYSRNNLKIIAGKKSDLNNGDVLIIDNMLLIGKVYNKENYKRITKEEFKRCSSLSFHDFVNRYWGNYIFLKYDNEQLKILRDPVGQFPLFYSKLDNGNYVFSSELENLTELCGSTAYNWDYLSSYILHGFITTKQTVFDKIYELPHGCQIIFDLKNGKTETSVVWNPLDYLHNCKSLCDARENIIHVISNVLKSWSAEADVISLDFSGGTDSTGILFLLNELFGANKEIILINMYHPEVLSSDERGYARSIANKLGLDLTEFDHSESMPFDPDFSIMKCKPNWPTSILSYLKINNDVSYLMRDKKNVLYMSGHGGDHIFSCPPPITSLCDYLINEGVRGFGEKLMDIYAIFRKPLLPIMIDVLKGFSSFYLSKYNPPSYYLNSYKKAPWLNEEIFLRANRLDYHPFLTNKRHGKCYPGEYALIDAIYSGLSTIKTDIRDYGLNPLFFPLFSQPVLELALSIPTYHSYHNGYNRYQFRKAISDRYSTDSVWRLDKGETSGVSQKGMQINESLIVELCMEGNMVKEGLINKEKLFTGLCEVIDGKKDYHWAITNLFCAEMFMTYWN